MYADSSGLLVRQNAVDSMCKHRADVWSGRRVAALCMLISGRSVRQNAVDCMCKHPC